jgi:two-component system, NarL family, response regulator NreC
MRPRVLLADDHVMVAEGLGRLIAEVAELVGYVTNGDDLIEATLRLRPDVVVSDISMPGLNGIDALQRLKARGSPARFIFLTIHAEPALAARAIGAGARGYVLKHAAGEELFEAIRIVMSGRTYLTPSLAGDVVRYRHANSDASALTPRQIEVLRLIARGKRMKEIAAELNLSVRTVEDHKARLMQVLGVSTTADLVRFAVKQGFEPE